MMSTSTLNRPEAAPCGCGAGTAGKALPVACSCGGVGCTACATQGYVRPRPTLITSVAPTLATALGVPVPADADGTVLHEFFV